MITIKTKLCHNFAKEHTTFMKNIVLALAISLISLGGFAQNFAWAQAWGGDSYDHSYSVATDDSGYIYTTGFFQGTTDFDPGPDSVILISSNLDIFIMKTSPTGKLVWVKQIGGSGSDQGSVVQVGTTGDVYITGSFNGTVDFDPGPGTHFLTNLSRGFALKLNASGEFIWAKTLGGGGYQLALDQNENVYTSGNFWGISDFDPGPATNTMDGGILSNYICKFTSNGEYVWARSFSLPADTNTLSIQSLVVDANENIYATGGFDTPIDFDPGAGTAVLTPSGHDVYILKLRSSGNFSWVKHLQQYDQLIPYGDGFCIGDGLTLDADANLYITGVFSGVVDFNPGPGLDTINSELWSPAQHYYYANMYIAKYDSLGNYIWAKGILSNYDIAGTDIELNTDGEIYTTGYYSGTVDFNPGAGIYPITNHNGQNIGNDIFIAKYNPQGDFIWAQGMGGMHHDRGYDLALDALDNVYVTGIFERTVDFDAGPGVWNLITTNPSSENHNGFLLKLSECVPQRDTVDITTCENQYAWPVNGFTYNRTGTYTHISAGAGGCDSLVTLELSIPIFANQPTYSNHTLLANPDQPADTYQWYDCNMPEVISGATQSSFLPFHNADYALIISRDGCVDTSMCLAVLNMDIDEYNKGNVSFFPNPTRDELHIQSSVPGSLSIQVMDVNGKEIYNTNKITHGSIISTENWNPGVYFISTRTDQSKQVYRIIKL